MVDVDGKDGDDDRERDKNHGEDKVFPNERDSLWRGGDDLLNDQEENCERHQDWGAERNLLTAVGGQIEDKNGEEGQANAGDNEEKGVEKRQPPDDEEVGDGGIGRAAVCPQTTAACGRHYLPFTVVKIVPLVHMEVLQNDVHLLNTVKCHFAHWFITLVYRACTGEQKLTWEPSYVHEPNFIEQFWRSKGKKVTSMVQADL